MNIHIYRWGILPLIISVFTVPVIAEISANVSLSTDYRFRGISQNDQNIAISGGFDYTNDNGFYAGIWASSVDFQIQTEDDASTEVDLVAGFSSQIANSEWSYDIGFIHYNYPNASSSLNYNFTEIVLGLSHEYFSVSYSYSSDYFGASGSSSYLTIGTQFQLTETWATVLSIGSQKVEKNLSWGTPDWLDYKIAITGDLDAVTTELAVIGTDLTESECFSGLDWCQNTVALSISKQF